MKTREAPIYQYIQHKFDNSIPMSSRIQPYPKTTSKTSISLTAVSTGSEFIEGLAIGIGAEGQIAGLEWIISERRRFWISEFAGMFFQLSDRAFVFFPRSLLTVPRSYSLWCREHLEVQIMLGHPCASADPCQTSSPPQSCHHLRVEPTYQVYPNLIQKIWQLSDSDRRFSNLLPSCSGKQ